MKTRWLIALKIPGASSNTKVLQRLRQDLVIPISELRSALLHEQPIPLRALFGLSHDEDERIVLSILEDIEALGFDPEIYVDGAPESRQYLLNLLERHRESAYVTCMEMDLESGEPSEEAVEWERAQMKQAKLQFPGR